MAKTSDQKAKVYSKYSREIYVCAKSGGADPDGNLALRSLIDRAKKDQVPAHVIDKAVGKARDGVGEDFAPARYEGFGPGNCMVIVDCLTDNPTRTFNDVRQCFTKTKAKIGAQGTVSHMFDHCAIFVFNGDEEAVLDALMMADVDVSDIEDDNGKLTVFTAQTDYFKTKQALADAFGEIEFEVDEIQFVPKGSTPVSGEDAEQFNRFIEMLDNLDDVQRIYHDAELS